MKYLQYSRYSCYEVIIRQEEGVAGHFFQDAVKKYTSQEVRRLGLSLPSSLLPLPPDSPIMVVPSLHDSSLQGLGLGTD